MILVILLNDNSFFLLCVLMHMPSFLSNRCPISMYIFTLIDIFHEQAIINSVPFCVYAVAGVPPNNNNVINLS